MLQKMQDMPGTSEVNVFVASRKLNQVEQQVIVQAHISWLLNWRVKDPARLASECSVILNGWIVAWAVAEHNNYPLLRDYDLYPLFTDLDGVFSLLTPPAKWTRGFALLYNNRAYSTPDDWRDLIVTKKMTSATIDSFEIVTGGKLAEMPEKEYRHLLKRDRDYSTYLSIIIEIANEFGITWA